MTYDANERSNYDGVPTTLYEFSLGSTYWRYSGGQTDIVVGGNTYSALAVADEGYTASGNPDTDDLSVRISARAEVTDLYIGTPPSEPVLLKVRRIHRGDTEASVVWSGSVKSGRQVSLVEFVFTANSLLSTLNRNGLRLSWGRGCPHALYDRNCRVDPDDYATAVQVGSLSGASVVSTALSTLGDGWLSGGLISFAGPHGNTERRAIESHTGSTIVLMGTTDGLAAGDWVMVYPGCDRVTATCETKFNNLSNYGGFPHLPTKSPFDGDPVF